MIRKILFLSTIIALLHQFEAYANPLSQVIKGDVPVTNFFVATSQVGDKKISGQVPETYLGLRVGEAAWNSGQWVSFQLEYDPNWAGGDYDPNFWVGDNTTGYGIKNASPLYFGAVQDNYGQNMGRLFYTVETASPITLSIPISNINLGSIYIRLGVSDLDATNGSHVEIRNITFENEGTPLINSMQAYSPVDICYLLMIDLGFQDGFKLRGQQSFFYTTAKTQLHDLYIDIFGNVLPPFPPTVPEPTTMALLGLSVFGYFIRRKK